MSDFFHRDPVDGYEMVLIPEGKAIFGSDVHESDEKPQFEAELPGCYFGVYGVTNAQYARFLNVAKPGQPDLEKWILLDSDCRVVRRGSGYAVDDDVRYGEHPVVQVSWYGAEAYCRWSGLRLPTELEWEKAARGTQGLIYPWGNEWDATKCHHAASGGGERTCRVWDHPEGASPFGVHNLSGNVWEWCADWYDEEAYPRYARGDLTAPLTGAHRVIRGVSWLIFDPEVFRGSLRVFDHPEVRSLHYGFRCASGL